MAAVWRSESVPDEESSPTLMQPFYDFFEQTKNFGQRMVERVSDIGTSMVDYVSEFFAQAKQETDDFFSRGAALIGDGMAEARSYGEMKLDDIGNEAANFRDRQVKAIVEQIPIIG